MRFAFLVPLGVLFTLIHPRAFAALPSDPVCIGPITTPATKPCRANAKSRILGDTLYIDGRIDGMTNDLMTVFNAGAAVKHVELNSYGGEEDEKATRLADMIRSRGMTTHVREGGFCASTCVLLFQAGVSRTAAPGVTFGIHGVRIGGMAYIKLYYDACGDDGSQEKCNVFTTLWYNESLEATHDYFRQMQGYGAAIELETDYLKQGKDRYWFRRGNGLRIDDWILDLKQAQHYGILTES